MKKKNIVYVNFAPYDNAGRMLDFLIKNFSVVIHFSYDHLRLKNGRRSKLFVYEKGKKILQKNLLWMRTPQPFLFFSLPIVAIAIFWQTYWETHKLRQKYGTFHIYMTVNAYTAWIGNILRRMGFVKKTIFWVWDYFPLSYPDWRLRIARRVYKQFDNPAITYSDKVVYLNKKLKEIRRESLENKKIKNSLIIPIGTNPIKKTKKSKKIIVGHMGMLKWGQGLDLLFDILPQLKKNIKNLQIEIIGSGPDEMRFRKRAKEFGSLVKFYGFVQNDDDVDMLISRWRAGIATYIPDKSSEHYWTDPSKIKAYINQGVPAITTNVPEFAKEIIKYNAGIVIDYYKKKEFVDAVLKLVKQKNSYAKGAIKLAKKYHYKKNYPKLFEI